jgi:hypothetical protein
VFERYHRSEKELVTATLEMYVQGISTRKVKTITEKLCGHEFRKREAIQMQAIAASSSFFRFSRELKSLSGVVFTPPVFAVTVPSAFPAFIVAMITRT